MTTRRTATRPVVVAADDRTGALEAAGAAADTGIGPVPVVSDLAGAGRDDAGPAGASAVVAMVVVDLASRHLTATDAAARAAALDAVATRRRLHKIDSTLRGNWAAELVARERASGRPVLLVPALPSLGRTCVGGEVLDGGRPVHEGPAAGDVRTPTRSSRPVELLERAGAARVVAVADGDDLARWLRRPDGIAVCDATTDADVAAIAAAWWSHPEVLLAGTSAAVGAAARCLARELGLDAGDGGSVGGAAGRAIPRWSSALVVCGSLHPAAREQVRRAVAAGAELLHLGAPTADARAARSPDGRRGGAAQPAGALGQVVILVATPPVVSSGSPSDAPSGPVEVADAARVARSLAGRAAELERALRPDVVVLVGGDTAAAVLGDRTVMVAGTLAPGTPWGHRAGDDHPVVTRAGGFGDADALVELLSGTLAP